MQHQHCNMHCMSLMVHNHDMLGGHKFEWGSTCTHHNHFLVSTCMAMGALFLELKRACALSLHEGRRDIACTTTWDSN